MLKVEWKKKSIEWGKWNFISLLQILLLFLLVRAFAVDVATTSFLLRHTHTRLSIRKSFLGKLLKKLFNTLITSFQKCWGDANKLSKYIHCSNASLLLWVSLNWRTYKVFFPTLLPLQSRTVKNIWKVFLLCLFIYSQFFHAVLFASSHSRLSLSLSLHTGGGSSRSRSLFFCSMVNCTVSCVLLSGWSLRK